MCQKEYQNEILNEVWDLGSLLAITSSLNLVDSKLSFDEIIK